MEVVYLFSELLCFIFLNNQRQGFDSCFEAQRALLLNTSRSLLAVFSFRVLLITRVTRCAQYVSRVSSSSSRSVLCDYGRLSVGGCMVVWWITRSLTREMQKCTMYPPNVHRGQISKIWPDFRNLTRGVYLWPPPQCQIYPLKGNAFWKIWIAYLLNASPLHYFGWNEIVEVHKTHKKPKTSFIIREIL